MSKELKEEILFSETFLSLREAENTSSTTLKIEAMNTGNCTFYWYDKGKLIEEVGFCINAFFNILMDIPNWFAKIGEAHFYRCETTTNLICAHDTDHPEIVLGIIKEDADTPSSLVFLERGTVISILDKIGHALAELENVKGCASNEDSTNSGDDDESSEKEDPFRGIDTSTVH